MITTNTGAKKLESSDNWREIFPNPGTSAAGAHNASVDAHDRIQAEVAPIINGKRCSLGAASGEYVLLRNSTIAGKTDGAYQAAKAIPANTDLDSTYLGSPITGGIVNELNNNITTLSGKTVTKYYKNTNWQTLHNAIIPAGALFIMYAAQMNYFGFGVRFLGSDSIQLHNLSGANPTVTKNGNSYDITFSSATDLTIIGV